MCLYFTKTHKGGDASPLIDSIRVAKFTEFEPCQLEQHSLSMRTRVRNIVTDIKDLDTIRRYQTCGIWTLQETQYNHELHTLLPCCTAQLSLPLNAHVLVGEGDFTEVNHSIQSSSRCVGDGVGKVVLLTSSSP
jgi:hypothetical protein